MFSCFGFYEEFFKEDKTVEKKGTLGVIATLHFSENVNPSYICHSTSVKILHILQSSIPYTAKPEL